MLTTMLKPSVTKHFGPGRDHCNSGKPLCQSGAGHAWLWANIVVQRCPFGAEQLFTSCRGNLRRRRSAAAAARVAGWPITVGRTEIPPMDELGGQPHRRAAGLAWPLRTFVNPGDYARPR